jgi:hypothetical protein
MQVTVTENVTKVTPSAPTSVSITESVTNVTATDTTNVSITEQVTNVSAQPQDITVSIIGQDTTINITEDLLGTSGSQKINQGTLTIELDKASGLTGGVRNDISRGLLRLLTSNRTNAGQFIQFADSNTTDFDDVGGIGMATAYSGASLFIGTSDCGLHFTDAFNTQFILPCDNQGANQTTVRLGSSSTPFLDIYSADGTVSTSDRTKKQDIQDLSDAERQVATACKSLIRKYKWKSAVQEKGSGARWHFGIMAQELEQAFSNEGLDASDYGVFIKEDVETDGVVETHYAVRYNELLAFILAAL